MNEHIDILLTTAKCATRNDPWAHLVTQSFSMGYNVSMLWGYQYLLAQATAMGSGRVTPEQINTIRQECVKHTILGLLDGLGLIFSAIGSLQEGKNQ